MAKRTQHVAPKNVALRCVTLRWHVAIVWPGLKNHARVLGPRQPPPPPPRKKMAGISSIVKAKQVIYSKCFSNFRGKQQHFNVSNIKLAYCFREESFFSDKINQTFHFPSVQITFGAKIYLFPTTLFTCFIHISNPLNVYARKPLSREEMLHPINSVMLKKIPQVQMNQARKILILSKHTLKYFSLDITCSSLVFFKLRSRKIVCFSKQKLSAAPRG